MGDEAALLSSVVVVATAEVEEVMLVELGALEDWFGIVVVVRVDDKVVMSLAVVPVGTAELKSEATSLGKTRSFLAITSEQKARVLLLCDRISPFFLLLKCVTTTNNVLGYRFLT